MTIKKGLYVRTENNVALGSPQIIICTCSEGCHLGLIVLGEPNATLFSVLTYSPLFSPTRQRVFVLDSQAKS
jgi:hypothetical protein